MMRTKRTMLAHLVAPLMCVALMSLGACSDESPGDTDGATTGPTGDTDDGAGSDDGVGPDDGGASDDSVDGDFLDIGDDASDAGATGGDAGVDGADAETAADIAAEDVPLVCAKGATSCEGARLATCGPMRDGWIVSSCFPGQTCKDGACVPVSNNLVIVFDTSGSMGSSVSGCSKPKAPWPACTPTESCTKMDVSKVVFSQALEKIDSGLTRMSLFRFPQPDVYKTSTPSCASGYYSGKSKLTGDTNDQQAVGADGSPATWFSAGLNETLCVPFPVDESFDTKKAMKQWMDGTESMSKASGGCSYAGTSCKTVAGCKGCCKSGECWVHDDPELRQTGGTPIGRTLYYVGEYLRAHVVIDGRVCDKNPDCGNVNYECDLETLDAQGHGRCVDPARSCRDNVVVVFTDGGETNKPADFFGPLVQAKRLAFGLACQSDADCVGGAACTCPSSEPGCTTKMCLPPVQAPNATCMHDMRTCLPPIQCPTQSECQAGEQCMCPGGANCTANPALQVCVPSATQLCTTDADCGSGGKCGCIAGAACVPKLCLPLTWCDVDPLACVAIPLEQQIAAAKVNDANVLRSPDGKPFGVRVHVVDISGGVPKALGKSMNLALAGNGKLLGADASDPDAFLATLNSVFDLKNKNVCGDTP